MAGERASDKTWKVGCEEEEEEEGLVRKEGEGGVGGGEGEIGGGEGRRPEWISFKVIF